MPAIDQCAPSEFGAIRERRLMDEFDRAYGVENRDLLSARTAVDLCRIGRARILGDGVYRIMDGAAARLYGEYLGIMFPDLRGSLDPFASDWLGRIMALRSDLGNVVIAQPARAEVLDLPADLPTFHAEEIVARADAALALVFYREWRTATGRPAPEANECVSHRLPVFLGGADEVGNLDLFEMRVYWASMARIVARMREMDADGRIVPIRLRRR